MTHRRLEIHTEAADEIESASAWYSLLSNDVAMQFVAEIDAAFDRILEAPERWPEHRHGTKRYLLKRFPYLVIYRLHADIVQIVACAHGRRRPGYWRDRINSR